MRKLGTIILLSLFGAVQIGVLAWYCYKPAIHTVCYEFFRQHKDQQENDRVIRMSVAAFRSAKQDEDEILWAGELYDVTKKTTEGNEVVLRVRKDMWENYLVTVWNDICRQIEKNKPFQTPAGSGICQWIFKWFVPAEKLNFNKLVEVKFIPASFCIVSLPALVFDDTPCQPPELTD